MTEAPAPHFISSRLRSLFLENTQYSVFDMRSATHFQIKVWSGTMTGRILYGETPLDLIEAYTEYAGRMRVLPDWVHKRRDRRESGRHAIRNQETRRIAPGQRIARRILDSGLGRHTRHLGGPTVMVGLAAQRELLSAMA
ncbi:MAG: hypothetical protein ABSA68_15760 [Xanthobacteraceae bacterium]